MRIIAVTKKKGGNNYDFWKQRTRANVYESFVVTAVLSARTFKRNRELEFMQVVRECKWRCSNKIERLKDEI